MFSTSVELPAPVRFAMAIGTQFRERHCAENEKAQKQACEEMNQ